MPLPDANKKSPRVYTNLQNLDLDNVTFANIQATGNPIAVEEMNEDEMRRLVLVNLARLVTAGEWTGLLEAGGGGAWAPTLTSAGTINSTFTINRVDSTPPWGITNGNNGVVSKDEPMFYPFIAPTSGDVDSMSIDLSAAAASTCNAKVGIYTNNDGVPQTLLGTCTFDAEVVDLQTQTSVSDTITLVKGTQYWMGYTRSASVDFTWTAGLASNIPFMGPTEQLAYTWSVFWIPTGEDNNLPSTITATDLHSRGFIKASLGMAIS